VSDQDDVGKAERPAPQPERQRAEPAQGEGSALSGGGVMASDLAYRVSGGQSGSPPLDRIRDQRRSNAADVVRRMGVMRKAGGAANAETGIPKTVGAPLGGDVRARMEPKLGADLSGVRVHTGGESAQAAAGFGARAFTVGSDVHFNAGQFSPGTKEGDKLLAHELTHVVQGQRSGIQRKAEAGEEKAGGGEQKAGGGEQKAGGGEGAKVSEPHEEAEKEADKMADFVGEQEHGGAESKDGGADKGNSKGKDKGKEKDKKKKGKDGKQEGKNDTDETKAEEAEGKEGVEQQAKEAEKGKEDKGDKGDKGAGEGPDAKEQAPPIAAKLEGVGLKIFRTVGPPPPPGPAPGPAPRAANPQAADIEADFKKVSPVATLDAYNAMIQSLSVLVTPESKASVNLRISKLNAAIARTKPKLTAIYGAKAPDMIRDFIDSRMPQAHAKPGAEFLPKAQQAKDALLAAPGIDKSKQADAVSPIVNYKICAPEEAATDKMMDESGGIMKVYDVGGLFRVMDKKYKDAWIAKFGDEKAAQTQFANACKATQKPALAPPGQENAPPFKGASVDTVFTGMLNGFVGQGKDAAGVGSFADAIQRFALNANWYPSKAMFVISAGAAEVKGNMKKPDAPKIGKPSIFNLLNFDENVYKEDDREYGHLADASGKAGNALELTCQDYPATIWGSAKFLG